MEWSRVKGIPNPKSAGKGKTVHAASSFSAGGVRYRRLSKVMKSYKSYF
jgi:hypothetical protein